MCALAIDHQTTIIRPVIETDARDILRLLEHAWRIHIRIAWQNLRSRLKSLRGILAEDQVGLRGFILFEPHPPGIAMIVAAGLRDTWGVKPFLELLLPEIEQIARQEQLTKMIYVGYEDWLISSLQQYNFETQDWIVTLEWMGDSLPALTSAPARLRMAHRNDLPALLAIDTLAFEYLWRKSAPYFSDALAHANSFAVAEISGHIVGYEWCEIHHKQAHITRLAVHPYYQGQGIGTQLLCQAITDMLTQGVNLITLNTQETNYRSQALYNRFGFVNTQQRVPVLWKML